MQRNGLKMTGENRKVSGMKQWFSEGETEAQFQTVVFCELGSEIEAEIWVLKCDADGWRCATTLAMMQGSAVQVERKHEWLRGLSNKKLVKKREWQLVHLLTLGANPHLLTTRLSSTLVGM
ncbi:hypothetical protein LR48_Vigan11g061900 [Vigna angularis]|uniref:Uncharacterized protein n=1 Tax=Phaseolus angularis TaxID=3914 RepID=A0A0L9VR88_PHAAN|nr:hypothetical protein LR48_Vigan11g061900 [Vigna angularis]